MSLRSPTSKYLMGFFSLSLSRELKMVKSQTKKNKPKRDGSHEGDSSEDEFSKAGDFSDIGVLWKCYSFHLRTQCPWHYRSFRSIYVC